MESMEGWPNGLVCYTEDDILVREFLIDKIARGLREGLRVVNPAIDFVRVETPALVPGHIVSHHVGANFPIWEATGKDAEETFYLRPETTRGTYEMFSRLFPNVDQFAKRLPLCMWQSGVVFRIEQDKTFQNLRFKQFYQQEFQLAYADGTKADYHGHAVERIKMILEHFFHPYPNSARVISVELEEDEIPFYSEKTTDIYVDDHWEVAAISSRTDFDHPILEISIGLDRLTAIWQQQV